MNKSIYLLLLIISTQIVSAAILHGTIYDTKLHKLNDVVVETNSTPPQVFVSKEGQYSFVLDPGHYTITAEYQISGPDYLYTSENFTISTNSYIKKDLLLKPAKKVEIPTGAVIGPNGEISFTLMISVISLILLISLGYTLLKLRSSRNLPECKANHQ